MNLFQVDRSTGEGPLYRFIFCRFQYNFSRLDVIESSRGGENRTAELRANGEAKHLERSGQFVKSQQEEIEEISENLIWQVRDLEIRRAFNLLLSFFTIYISDKTLQNH